MFAFASACLAGTAVASTLPTLTVALSPTAVVVGGATQSGAVNVAVTGPATKEAAAILVRLKPGVTAGEFDAFLAANAPSKDPNTVSKLGSIVFDAEAVAGKTVEAQTTLEPGQYVFVNSEGEKPASKNPHTYFTVIAAGSPATLPAAQAVERTIDFGFRGPRTLHDGEVVRFENEGFLVHMDIAFPTRSQAAAKRAAQIVKTGNVKQVGRFIAGEPVTFAGPVSSGAFQQSTITAKPGWYVQVCFMRTQDGRDHAVLGMERVIHVTR
jgi:hypothetical protein